MAEDELGFDPTLKKKKKKKKPMGLDGEEELAQESTTDAPPAEAAENDGEPKEEKKPEEKKPEAEVDGNMLADVLAEDLDLTMKKKKKKKKTTEEDAPVEEAPVEEVKEDDGGISFAAADEEEFALTSKKKKKKSKKAGLEGLEDEGEGKPSEDNAEGDNFKDSDRDYEYTELLDRVFSVMRARNPDMVAGEKKKFVMKPPQVVRLGTRKSAFVNFTEICKLLHRQPDHLLAFLCAELGTSGSVDSSQALVIKGRFQQKQIESVLRRYIREYVTCHTCKSPDTILAKENRLYFLQCESCQSRCSVQNIKSGFQALTGKRAAMRAKEQ